MATRIRLSTSSGLEPNSVRFTLAFTAPDDQAAGACAPASLDTGDGYTLDLGLLCAPTAFTWREQRQRDVGTYRYTAGGPFTAQLRWGETVVEATIRPGQITPAATTATYPELTQFTVDSPPNQPLSRTVKLKVTGLAPAHRLRLDGGAGQIHRLSGVDGPVQAAEWTLNYAKPGPYTLALDLLDADGFWLTTLAESAVEIVPPVEGFISEKITPSSTSASAAATAQAAAEPWLPYRYVRPVWGGARVYANPGGGLVTRVVGSIAYLSIRAETTVNGTLWYRTAGGDWIAANTVNLVIPSKLRGVQLGATTPPPEPPPPPPPPADLRHGVVTASMLNVRAQPGVWPANPPVDKLPVGTEISIHEETTYAGATWYRIGDERWVHGGYVRLVNVPEPPPTPPEPPEPPPTPPQPPADLRHGVVTAWALNVRAHPGVQSDNPPVAQLHAGAEVSIYEEATYAGATWYRIGDERWVHSGYVRLVDTPEPTPPTPPPPPADLRHGVVTAPVLNVRAQPGVRANNPPVDKLRSGAEVTIYAEQSYGGATWYRIGDKRWVHSGWIRLTGDDTRFVANMEPAIAESGDTVSLPVGWVVAPTLNVRARPGVAADNPPIDQVTHNQMLPILDTRAAGGTNWYRIGEDRWVVGSWIGVARFKPRPSSIGPDERWVAVCLQQQTAVAYEGDRPVYAALVATGLPGTTTVQGIFHTWLRLKTGKMAGSGYYLEDVTWTCYFHSGYALHTAYWHDAFGRPRSHGCVNISPYDAWWIYQWSAPGGPNSPAVYVYWV